MSDYPEIHTEIHLLAAQRDLRQMTSLSNDVKKLMEDTRHNAVLLASTLADLGLFVGPKPETLIEAIAGLSPDPLGRLFVNRVEPRENETVHVADLDKLELEHKDIAAYFGVTSAQVRRFLKACDFTESHWDATPGQTRYRCHVDIGCQHPEGCGQSRYVTCENPKDYLLAERRQAREKWFCQRHEAAAWERERQLCDLYQPELSAIKASPGTTRGRAGLDKRELDFLSECGVVNVERVEAGGRLRFYRLFLTELGQQVLDALSSPEALEGEEPLPAAATR